jgi:hypothetical protein
LILTISLGQPVLATAAHEETTDRQGFTRVQLRRLLRSRIETISEIANNPVVVSAVRKQNRKAMTRAKIDELDATWQASKEDTPFKVSLQENTAGRYFQSLIDFNEAIYNEAFLTDRRGANVAAYPVTSDSWQGDEEKWLRSFNAGVGEVFIGKVEFDESTKTTAIQISVPVMDHGETIGVLIFGIKLTYVQARYFEQRHPASAK